MESLVDKGLVLALFEEGAHALLLVGALEAGAEGLLLDHDGAVNVDLKTVVDACLDARTAMGALPAIWPASFSAAA